MGNRVCVMSDFPELIEYQIVQHGNLGYMAKAREGEEMLLGIMNSICDRCHCVCGLDRAQQHMAALEAFKETL